MVFTVLYRLLLAIFAKSYTMENKYAIDMVVKRNAVASSSCRLLVLSPVKGDLPPMRPGQFVEVKVDVPGVFLRRPISVCNVEGNDLWLLVRRAGKATDALCDMAEGTIFNVVMPLGNGFSIPEPGTRVLLVGGGVGVAPMLYYARKLSETGVDFSILTAAKTKCELMLMDEFEKSGNTVYVATDDGSYGHKGFAASHPVLCENWDLVACCGPLMMMKSIASVCHKSGNRCEVSLENLMACGLGACLCCVESTVDKGNVCVCKDGPVFDINVLKWQD